MVPNNRAAGLLIFLNFPHQHALLGTTYITVHKNTYTLVHYFGFCPTYIVNWTPHLFGTLEYLY